MIEDVEELTAKLSGESFPDFLSLAQRQVEVFAARTVNGADPRVAQSVLGLRRKRAGVEELINAAAHITALKRIHQRRPWCKVTCGEGSCWPEERAGGAVVNTEWESGLERHDTGEGPPG